jgi:hypothetical protein
MSFAKLDTGIVHSTLWVQPHDVLRVWIAMLSQCNSAGIVKTAAPPLAHLCMVPLDRIREIIALLESPDPDSRSCEHDGRRIIRIDGGWQIVNYLKYREARSTEERKEYQREWDRKYRSAASRNPTASDSIRQESDNSQQNPTNPTKEEEEEEEERSRDTPKGVMPPVGGVVAIVLDAYHATLPK